MNKTKQLPNAMLNMKSIKNSVWNHFRTEHTK